MAKKKKKKKGEKILNDRPRKVFRKRFMSGEFVFGIAFVIFVGLMAVWFGAQRDNFDPGERDISMEVMIAQSVEDHLWEPPLSIWIEPGSESARGSSGPDVGIYPASVLSDGWMTTKPVVVFDWDNLYEKVDGQETQYKAFGFEFMHYLGIEQSEAGLECSIELYDMVEFKNALGVFSEQRSAESTVEAQGDAWVSMTQAGALAIVGKYYIKFVGNADDKAIRSHAINVIADFAKANAAANDVPAAFTLMTRELGVQFQDIGYKKEDVFQYDFAKDFWFGGLGGDSTGKIFVHKAESAEAAAALFAQITEEHEWDYDVISKEDTDAVFFHTFLKTFNTVNVNGPFVYGVEGLKDKDATLAIVADVQKALNSV